MPIWFPTDSGRASSGEGESSRVLCAMWQRGPERALPGAKAQSIAGIKGHSSSALSDQLAKNSQFWDLPATSIFDL